MYLLMAWRLYAIFPSSPVITTRLKFDPKGPTDNKAALIQVMAGRRTGDKPLPKAMPNQFTDAYMRHQGEMS